MALLPLRGFLGNCPSVRRATVLRTLQLLCDHGLLERVRLEDGKDVYVSATFSIFTVSVLPVGKRDGKGGEFFCSRMILSISKVSLSVEPAISPTAG